MNSTTRRRFLVGLGAVGATAWAASRSTAAAGIQDLVEIKPRELDEVLVNPGIGFETSRAAEPTAGIRWADLASPDSVA